MQRQENIDLIQYCRRSQIQRKSIFTFEEMAVQFKKEIMNRKINQQKKIKEIVTAPLKKASKLTKLKNIISIPIIGKEYEQKNVQYKNQHQSTLGIIDQNHRVSISTSSNGNIQIGDYQLLELIGRGNFGQVHICKNKLTDQIFAIKMIDVQKLKLKNKSFTKLSLEQINNIVEKQINIVSELDHPNIIKLVKIIQEQQENKYYLVTQYCQKGAINKLKNKNSLILQFQSNLRILSEDQLKNRIKKILLALDYIHNEVNMAHKNIRPEKFLIDSNNQVKINCFGLSANDSQNSYQTQRMVFLAPQVFKKQQSINFKSCDIWSLGITILILLIGKSTYPEPINSLYIGKIIQQHNFAFDSSLISKQLQNFLQKCLEKNPKKRATINQLLKHDWILQKTLKPKNFDKSNK